MESQISHRHASSSSRGIRNLVKKQSPKLLAHPLNSACLQRDLMSMSFPDLLKVATQLKHAGVVTTLRLFVSPNEQHIVNQRFSSLDRRTVDAAFAFTRALSRAIEGWMHDVEIGFSLWNRDLKVLSEAFGFTKTLRRLSFANSGLGDVRLETLAGGLRECVPLQTLELSRCALSDASVAFITTIVKSAVTRKAELEWKASLREPVGCKGRQENHLANKITTGNLALAALDLSYNAFTDTLPRELCYALRMGAPLLALNLRFNQMTRVGAKLLLEVMQEYHILRLVDLRGNEDEKLLGVLENGEHSTSFSTFQAPFWLESTTPETNHRNSETLQESRNSEIVRSLHADQRKDISFGKCNLNFQSTTSTRAYSKLRTTSLLKVPLPPSPEEVKYETQKLSICEGGIAPCVPWESPQDGTEIMKMQPPPKKERPYTGPERFILPALLAWPEQKGSRPTTASDRSSRCVSHHVPSWNRDNVCKHTAPPGMIDPPRDVIKGGTPKMFTNELYEDDTESLTSTSGESLNLRSTKKVKGGNSNSCFSSLRNDRRRSRAELAHKRKSPDRRSRRPTRTSRKSPPSNQLARTKYLTWDVQHQKKSKQILRNVLEEQPMSLLPSKDIVKKEVEWSKFVTEMTDTLLNLRDGLDRLIGPSDVLAAAEKAAHKLPKSLLARSGMFLNVERSCQVLDSQATSLHKRHKKAVQDWETGDAHQVDVRQPSVPKKKLRKRTCKTRMRV